MAKKQTQSGQKESRQEAILRELQRRERALGVPDERQVYVLKQHFEDEGGPCGLCPKELSDGSGRDTFDFEAWRERLQHAPVDWTPAELALQSDRRRGSLPGDFCEFNQLIIFSRRAYMALGPLLDGAGVVLPVTSDQGDFVGFRLDASIDALDEERSSVNWSQTVDHRVRWASSISRYAFHTNRLTSHSIFRIPQHWQILVLRPFVDVVRREGLTGMQFCRVWPNAMTGLWWQQKENWC